MEKPEARAYTRPAIAHFTDSGLAQVTVLCVGRGWMGSGPFPVNRCPPEAWLLGPALVDYSSINIIVDKNPSIDCGSAQ